MTLPRLGEGSVMLSRYPFWAVSCVLLARLSGVVLGDAYLLLGLGTLALVLGQMAAFVTRAWSSKAGILWVLAIVALGPLLSDSLLNYGGYPFPDGEALRPARRHLTARDVAHPAARRSVAGSVRRADSAAVAHEQRGGHRGRPVSRRADGVGSATAPPACRGVRLDRGAGSGSRRFGGDPGDSCAGCRKRDSLREPRRRRFPSASPASRRRRPRRHRRFPPVIKDPVARRLAMFVSRGTPLELVVVVLALALVPLIRRLPLRGGELVRSTLIAAAAGMVLLFFSADAARLALTTALKPGYFRLRDGLLSGSPSSIRTSAPDRSDHRRLWPRRRVARFGCPATGPRAADPPAAGLLSSGRARWRARPCAGRERSGNGRRQRAGGRRRCVGQVRAVGR